MAPWLRSGAALLIPDDVRHHLHCMLAAEDRNEECILLMVTSVKPGRVHDPACVLRANDHPFIRHDSYVLYRTARIVRASHVTRLCESGYWLLREPFSPAVHARIARGLASSDETRRSVLSFARDVGIV